MSSVEAVGKSRAPMAIVSSTDGNAAASAEPKACQRDQLPKEPSMLVDMEEERSRTNITEGLAWAKSKLPGEQGMLVPSESPSGVRRPTHPHREIA